MPVDPVQGKIISKKEEFFFKFGETLIQDTVNLTREFCKLMITVTAGAIPVYMGLLKFTIEHSYSDISLIHYVSPFLFLLACLIFIYGYLPKFGLTVSFVRLGYNEVAYRKLIKRRQRVIMLGIATFVSGSGTAIVSLLLLIDYL